MARKVKTAARRECKTQNGSAKKTPLQIPKVKVGEKVRLIRKENGYSIHELSEMSGVSMGGISKIEMNVMAPTITTLVKLATALERRASFFVEEEDSYPPSRLICKSDRKIIASGQEGCTEIVAERLRSGCIEARYQTLEPGSKNEILLVSFEREYLIYCLKGELSIRRSEDSYKLKAGDSFHCESNYRVLFENNSRSETRFLIVNANLSAN